MNLLNTCTTAELKLLQSVGINIENKEYKKEELERFEYQIEDYIMSHSTKNNDIDRLNNEFSNVLYKMQKHHE